MNAFSGNTASNRHIICRYCTNGQGNFLLVWLIKKFNDILESTRVNAILRQYRSTNSNCSAQQDSDCEFFLVLNVRCTNRPDRPRRQSLLWPCRSVPRIVNHNQSLLKEKGQQFFANFITNLSVICDEPFDAALDNAKAHGNSLSFIAVISHINFSHAIRQSYARLSRETLVWKQTSSVG